MLSPSLFPLALPALFPLSAGVNVALFSMADHYSFWAAQPAGTSAAGGGGGGGCGKPGIAYVDVDGLNEAGRQHIKALLRAGLQAAGCDVELVVVSLHWGSNYCWSPAAEFTRFAHFLIDECGVDIIHGHSSHHVQGMELYRGRPVLYGCGDFLDDYAVHEEYRNDLSAVYEVEYDVEARRCVSLEVVPTACHMMRVSRQLAPGDRRWLCTTMQRLCRAFGTQLQVTPEGTLRAVLPVSGPPVSAASGGEDCTAADRGISKAGQRGGSAAVSGQQPVDTTSSGATAVSTSAPRGGG